MRRIGIRELRQNASEYLRLVKAGETLEITDRGSPVALLVPTHAAASIEQLERSGRLAPATGDLLELGAPLAPEEGLALPSDVLRKQREAER